MLVACQLVLGETNHVAWFRTDLGANSEMKDRQVGSHEQTRTEQSYNYLSICQNEFGYIEHGIVPQSIVAPVHLLQNIETLLRTPMCLDRTESHAP